MSRGRRLRWKDSSNLGVWGRAFGAFGPVKTDPDDGRRPGCSPYASTSHRTNPFKNSGKSNGLELRHVPYFNALENIEPLRRCSALPGSFLSGRRQARGQPATRCAFPPLMTLPFKKLEL